MLHCNINEGNTTKNNKKYRKKRKVSQKRVERGQKQAEREMHTPVPSKADRSHVSLTCLARRGEGKRDPPFLAMSYNAYYVKSPYPFIIMHIS